jgi:hypothetical protein
MRTIFEDTAVKAEMEEARNRANERKSTLPILWLTTLLFLLVVGGVYRWVESRPAIEPPAPPASLDDPKQTSDAFTKFNRFALDGKWTEAEAMLSNAAKQRLANEQKSLPESLLGKFKDYKMVGADMTQSIDRSVTGMVRLDCLYKFTNDENYTKIEESIVPLTLVIENGKLVIDGWESADSQQRKQEGESKAAENK